LETISRRALLRFDLRILSAKEQAYEQACLDSEINNRKICL
jgi:hypothetical protein